MEIDDFPSCYLFHRACIERLGKHDSQINSCNCQSISFYRMRSANVQISRSLGVILAEVDELRKREQSTAAEICDRIAALEANRHPVRLFF